MIGPPMKVEGSLEDGLIIRKSKGCTRIHKTNLGTNSAVVIKTMLKDFRAYQLAKTLYQACKPLKVPSHLKDQLSRASASIVLNLAESSGRRTHKEKLRYFTISLGSLRETQAILEMENIEDSHLNQLTDQLGAMLYKLSQLPEKLCRTEMTPDDSTGTSIGDPRF